MNKKSAMAISGGLVAALASAIGAVSTGVTSGPTAQAEGQPQAAASPIVRTIHRTVTIHKKPKQASAPVQIVQTPPSAATTAPVTHSSGSLTSGHDDEGEHEGYEDDHEGGDD